MAFGQAPAKPIEVKTTFYIKESKYGGYFGSIGDDKVEVKLLPTGGATVQIGGKDGPLHTGASKTSQYGEYHLFVIDGFLWFGAETDGKWGKKYKLKMGKKAEDSDDWKAKQQAAGQQAASQLQPDTTGVGPAGLAAPQGQPAGVQIQQGSTVTIPGGTTTPTAPKPPKPAGYKRPTPS